METFELRYFLGVAKTQNIHRASEDLNVSPGSLSKAVARLEDELSVSLFSREGRIIKLTDQGRLLQKRASEIIQLEEATRLELAGIQGSIRVIVTGPEILLSQMGFEFTRTVKKKYPTATFEFIATDDLTAIEKVSRGEAHIAIVTADFSSNSELSTKFLEDSKFQTYVGQGHPLYTIAKSKKIISIDEVLKYSFVSPNNPLLGKVGVKQSLDGWRDDQFPRKIEYFISSLKILEEFVVGGKAIAYLPDYYAKRLNVEMLKVTGCPYYCSQKVKMVARHPKNISWLNHFF